LLLSPASVTALLARFAPSPDPALPAFDPADPFAVAEALSYRVVPGALADVFADLTRIATPVGHEAMLETLAASETPASRDLRAFSPEDLGVRLLCARGLSPRRARAALRRVLIRVARHFAPRAWYTLVSQPRELPVAAEALIEAGRAVHGTDFVKGWVASHHDGVLRVIVVYRALARRVGTRQKGVSRVRTQRPYACDVVRWDSRDGRVSFSLGRTALLTDWAIAISKACAPDAQVFSEQPAYTLKSLHEKGAAWVASVPLPTGVTALDLVACEVDYGKRVRVRDDAALSELHALVGQARGYLRSATFRMTIDGHDEPVDFTIEVPWKLLLSDARFEEEARLVMNALEMHAAGSLPDDVPSLAPMQPEWRWSDLLGPAGFARAVETKVLTRVRGKRPSAREHRRWGSLLRAFEMRGEDAAYVVGEEMAIRAFDAKPEALDWYVIDWARVAEVLRGAMGLTETRVTDAPAGFVPIGEIGVSDGRVIVFSLARVVGEGEAMALLKQLRRACGRATPALLVPRGRSLGGAVAEVEVSPGEQLGVEDVASVAGRIAEECGFGDEMEPGMFATEDAPLVLSVGRGEAWYGRVRLALTENQLAMLFALARCGWWMKSTELGQKIQPGAEHPDQIVRKARLTLVEKITASFAGAGVKMPKGLAERLVTFDRSKGYRLGVGVIVR